MNKQLDRWQVQGYYNDAWNEVTSWSTRRAARNVVQRMRTTDPTIATRIIDTTPTLSQRFIDTVLGATVEQVESGIRWYDKARDVAQRLADTSGLPLEMTAAVIAALSPRMPWNQNIRKARELVSTDSTRALGLSIRTARDAMIRGVNALNGRKTRAFALAILGDETAVVVDTWMYQAAGLSGRKTNHYDTVEQAVRETAQATRFTPAQCQAIIWVVTRGRAE